MRLFHVVWEIDIEADSPQNAAREALAIQRDLTSLAMVFDVTDFKGETTRVNLDEDE